MPSIADRVRETTTTTGTGTVSLGGAATGFRAFSSAFATGTVVYYCITDGTNWEVGYGAVTTGTPWTLARSTVLASSNAGSLVSFGAGSKDVFCTQPASMLNLYALLAGSASQAFSMSTAAQGTNTTRGATTAFVVSEINKHKNVIIGGDFSTNPWQRGTSFTLPALTENTPTSDRFLVSNVTDGALTVSKTADAPTVETNHCLTVTVTTADTAIGADQYSNLVQTIEGYNAAKFGFGKPGTRYVTLSFWVKSSLVGTYGLSAICSNASRSYLAEYTINVANTWEKKTVTIPVDTTGTWYYDAGVGIFIVWNLACGTTYRSTAGSWLTGLYFSTANQVNLLATAGNTFSIALIQMEAGSVATPFEFRDYGTELRLCQRYYATFAWQVETVALGYSTISMPVTMRANPTIAGGGAGFTVATAGTQTNIVSQTTAATQTLTFNAEL